jgi:arylsulfatase
VGYVRQHLATYKEFPPRRKAGTFGLDQVLEKLHEDGGDK